MLLLTVIGGQKKNNLRGKFKLELLTTYHLMFVVKILWM